MRYFIETEDHRIIEVIYYQFDYGKLDNISHYSDQAIETRWVLRNEFTESFKFSDGIFSCPVNKCLNFWEEP